MKGHFAARGVIATDAAAVLADTRPRNSLNRGGK